MNALFDAARPRSLCILCQVRAYSASVSPLVARVPVRSGGRQLRIIRRDLEYSEPSPSSSSSSPPSSPHRHNNRLGGGDFRGQRPRTNAFLDGYGARPNHRPDFRPDNRRKFALFGALIDSRFSAVLTALGPWTTEHKEYLSFGLHSQAELDRQAKLFRTALSQCLQLASGKGQVSHADNPLFWSLRNAFVRGDTGGLTKELKYAFQSFILRTRVTPAVTTLQEAIADFRFPYEWYPATRTMQRTIHLHVGPTNSGKTYRALQALESAQTGIYAGPLRLLAHEIYARFLAKGKPCALITGEEQRFPMADGSPLDRTDLAGMAAAATGSGVGVADTYFQSCTVEMTPLNKRVDVAVIDEIQMIADPDRGWAWTQAFLGVQAREVHLCGEERAVDLIRALCARIGDRCKVHRYQRLSTLQTLRESLHGDFANLRKGDAVVSFSRVGLHTLKAGIETTTGRRCAIVYGSLPPETRAQQAALFNDPDNDYDFLVASDAIGMGLNLEVKRVIFETATKHDGMGFRHLSVPEIKQIGGRAGRYRTAAQEIKAAKTKLEGGETTESGSSGQALESPVSRSSPPPSGHAPPAQKWGTPGFVATLEEEDLAIVQKAFRTEAEPLKWAGIQPPTFAIERFSRYFPPDTPFSFILMRLRELARVSSRFQLCTPKESLDVADIIQPFPMSIYDRCIFIAAPVALRDPGQKDVLAAMARCVSGMHGGDLLDIPEIDLEILDATRDTYVHGPEKYLWGLEALHKAVTLYLWLSYRYVGVFTSQQLAFHVKGIVEGKITEYLENLTFAPERRQQRARTMRKMAEKHDRTAELFEDSDEKNSAEEHDVEEKDSGAEEDVSVEGTEGSSSDAIPSQAGATAT